MTTSSTNYSYNTAISKTGDTVDANITIIIDSRKYQQSITMIKNVGGNSITFSLLTRVIVGGINTSQEISSTVLTPGSTIRYISSHVVSSIEITLVSSSAGNPSSYVIESFGQTEN